MTAREVVLDDWPAVKQAWLEFKASPSASFVEGGVELLQSVFLASLLGDKMKMFGVFLEEKVVSLVTLQEFASPCTTPDGLNFVMKPYTFIRFVFSTQKAPRGAVQELDKISVAWSKARGHFMISGNCRMEFPLRLARKYGYRPTSLAIGKIFEEE